MTIKIAFFDIDNTLYDWKTRTWVKSGLESIKELQKRGVKAFICSARPWRSMHEFGVFDLGVKWDGYISSCGAVAYYKKHYIEKSVMPPEMVRKVIRMAKERGCVVEIVGLKSRHMSGESNDYVARYYDIFHEERGSVKTYRGSDVTSLLFFGPEQYDEDFKKEIPTISWYRFNDVGVDVSHEPHHKGNAITKVMKYFGFEPQEGIAFGDELQDMTMKGPVGTFVCVGNGNEKVKEMADYVSPAIIDDGIEYALKDLKII